VERECVAVEVFPVLGETATATKPTNGTLNDPAFRQNDEASGLIATADDLGDEARQSVRQSIAKDWSRIGAVGKQPFEKRELSEQRGQNHETPVTVLNISGRDQRVQQQAQCVDENVALLAPDQFASIKPMGIDAGAPFSALFTLWLSTTQAVGLASRSACSRHLT
jgi:hypothetical protein